MKKIEKILKNFFKDAEAIYLFGSYANGTHNENSDVDVAVLYRNKLDSVELLKKKEDLFLMLDRMVDLVDLQDVSDVFAFEIINHSKILKSSKFSKNYEYRVWLRYLDLQEDRKEIIKGFING